MCKAAFYLGRLEGCWKPGLPFCQYSPVRINPRYDGFSLFELRVYLPAFLFDLCNHLLALVQLLAHVLDGALQDETFGSALALKTGHQLRKPVEAFADCLASLLLCKRCVSTSLACCQRRSGLATHQRQCGSASSPPRLGGACRRPRPLCFPTCSVFVIIREMQLSDVVLLLLLVGGQNKGERVAAVWLQWKESGMITCPPPSLAGVALS